MTQEGFKRKLTSIFSADAVGYNRLMAEDEAHTVKTIATYREIFIPVSDNGGTGKRKSDHGGEPRIA